MAEIVFKLLKDDTDPLLDQIKPLFSEMYRGMKAQGMILSLADDGADKWFNSLLPAIGRFGILAVALEKSQVIGFAHGALKLLPDYLGGHKTGVITHIFVRVPYRGHKIGINLVRMLEKWFLEKKVHSIELQVISGNDAKEFWEKCGYMPELNQYRKFPGNDL